MDLEVVVVFVVFFVGAVVAFQGLIGKEISPSAGPWRALPYDPEQPGMDHPPERHPKRLVLIGAAIMAAAVLLGLVVM
jgi:hypothetical protein